MLRAMDSAVAGLRAHQNKMDVIGHNLANINTFGYKAQTYNFKEAMYQTSTASTGGTVLAGGVNAAQYGYGTLMGSIGMDMTASTPTYVGGFNATINGDGFFITRSTKPSDDIDPSNIKESNFAFTRVGQFSVDSNGYVVDANGNFVYGFRIAGGGDGTGTATSGIDGTTGANVYDDDKLVPLKLPSSIASAEVTIDGNEPYTAYYGVINDTEDSLVATSVQINNYGEITVTVKAPVPDGGTGGADDTAEELYTVSIGKVAIATFQNPNGMTKAGESYYTASKNDNTGAAYAAAPGDGVPNLMTGYVENSNVDMANEFALMITTHRGFQANSKMITVSDEMLNELVNMKR